MDTANKGIQQLITKEDLIQQFKLLGVNKGMVLEVHSSLNSFGYVCGGAQTVVDALIECVGYDGTILMALQCGNNSEPSYWVNPPINHELHEIIRDHTPAFHKKESDASHMGRIVDNFRRRDGIVYSNHPSLALVAWGKYAKLLCNRQSLHFGLSEESPIARLYELKGYVLLLGVGYDNCTSMHLAEYRSECRPIIMQGSAVEVNGNRIWKKYLDLDLNSDDFIPIGKQMEEMKMVSRLKIGKADCKLFRADKAIDFATQYFENSI